MNRILVTGSRGQLGLTLQEFANRYPKVTFDFKTSEELDITQSKQVMDTLSTEEYDYCINCSAYTNVEEAEKNPKEAFLVNAKGVQNLAVACKENKVNLIHISTDYVFDGKKDGGYTVHDKTDPINEYGKSKLAGEKFVRETLPSHYIIRTSWLYSKKYGHNFYRSILERALAGKDLHITDAQLGCPTNTESLVKYIMDRIVLGDMPFGTYHFTDGKPMTWYSFAKTILEENNLVARTNLVLDRNYRTLAKRPRNSVLL
ncbi:dTDP-4-dehydrorhamnose reductase [Flagellimonas crocea]|uniref:dTDP-4-dehydrorhamnose reductase n=1 Tax=Flagellimonas crocea TaxID=3067311 RepID=UPI00296F086E|nr:dTDP-4-dehydrorhamnose reductase [Muricauda sp. DH64]